MPEYEQQYGRAFICISLSPHIKAALTQMNSRVRAEAPGLSCVHPEHAHITLAFLGKISGSAASCISSDMDRICSHFNSFRLKLGEGGYFGSRLHPKVLWVGFQNSPQLTVIQGQIADAVRHAGVILENRPFKPHLTVARIRSPLPPGSLTSIISCINNTHFAEIMVDHVLFMNSRLNGPGPRFTTIHRARLKGS